MTAEREKAIIEWLDKHCRNCANNDDRGTDYVNCQAGCEVEKDIGIACIHYEEAFDIEPQEIVTAEGTFKYYDEVPALIVEGKNFEKTFYDDEARELFRILIGAKMVEPQESEVSDADSY